MKITEGQTEGKRYEIDANMKERIKEGRKREREMRLYFIYPGVIKK
jgi:hypothetical protein